MIRDEYVLPITAGDGELLPWASHVVMALMWFADDLKTAQSYIASSIARCFADVALPTGADVTIPVEILARAIDAPTFEQFIKKGSAKIWSGQRAADVLMFVITAHLEKRGQASVSRAVHVIQKEMVGARRQDGKAVNYSKRSIWAAWKSFRPVAHLWAAQAMHKQADGGALSAGLPDRERLIPFLSTAEAFRSFGTQIVAAGQAKHHGPVLDLEASWAPPSDLQLQSVTMTTGDLHTRLQEHLAGYPS